MGERGNVSQHAFELEVVRFVGGFGLAADVEEALAVVPFGDHDGRIHAFADIERVAAIERGRHRAPVSDELPGNRWNAPCKDGCQRRGRQQFKERGRKARRWTAMRDQETLALLGADSGNQDEAEGNGPDDCADGIGGVDSAGESACVSSVP